MRTFAILAASVSLLAGSCPSYAADHLFTATAAGGLTLSSQPFLNGTNNKGRSGEDVPGQGSVLSGDDHTVPATDTQTAATLKTPPPVLAGKTAPSSNASIP
jgi:hypothetical protein